jgi:hypothetical protein
VTRTLRQRQDIDPVDWAKLDINHLVWTIPEERMKGENGEARAHMVPLTLDILRILETLPRFNRGDHLFSTTFGEKPVWISAKVKKAIDALMLEELQELARRQGDDPAKVVLKHWVNHDIRRTIRTNLSRLQVTEEAREAVMAHVRPTGNQKTYDVYDYFVEKREALEQWAESLLKIVEPTPSNVVPLNVTA